MTKASPNAKSQAAKSASEPAMRVKIWGARGSLPAPMTPAAVEAQTRDVLKDFIAKGYRKESEIERFLAETPRYRLAGYGGNTPCIEVITPDAQVIVDGGSGIRPLGYQLMAGPCGKGGGEVHIFFTHFHWDHLIGLPFFTPIFIPGNKIHVYAVQPELPEAFRTVFSKPYFPVPLEKLPSEIVYHRLEPRKPFRLGELAVTPYRLDHPDPCWGFKFERQGKAFSHCVDTECSRVSREDLGADLPLYQDVDTMIFDAQYTLMETIEKVNWGHAAASLGIDIALRENIRRVVFMHHDPASSNEKIAAAEAQAKRYYESQIKSARKQGAPVRDLEWSFAFEGMVLDI